MWQTHGTMRGENGFTLLEALVTVVVVSIGLLGLLALQTASLANTRISSARTQATLAVESMADRMRANREAVASNAFDGIDHPYAGTPPKLCRDGASCNALQLAAYDAYQWDGALGELGNQLPNGEGAITCIDTDGSACVRYRITVSWHERVMTSDPTQSPPLRTFETVVRP